MATLILTAVGSAIGGPLGGAIGSIVGQQLDRMILGSGKAREGARLKELQVQTSSYGTQIPAVLGTMRVAGTVIWATDLVERRVKSGGGKGQPAVVNYSYAANFAVALSSKPLIRIGRIWADGNLMRGAAGDFKVQTGFRFYSGDGDQGVDPLMASANGTQRCPAHRGLAYAVFEELQLAEYGNRIPSLTFELFERDGSLSLATVAGVATNDLIAGQSAESVSGYALQGPDAASALRPLLDTAPIFVRPDNDRLAISDWFAGPMQLAELLPIADVSGNIVERPGKARQPDLAAPNIFTLRHFEPARDFQAGVQQSQRGPAGTIAASVDCPAAMSSSQAKRFADLALLQQHRNRSSVSLFALSAAGLVKVGDWIADGSNRYRIREIEKFAGFERIDAVGWLDQDPLSTTVTDAGISIGQPDLAIGETRLIVVDLPLLEPADVGKPQIFVAATGTEAGWRGANIALRDADRLNDLGGSAQPAALGILADPLSIQDALLIDEQNEILVDVINPSTSFPPGTGDPLSPIAPAIWIEGEIIRYGSAEYLGGKRFRIRRLARGLAGTEDKILPHPIGARLLLLEADTLLAVDPIIFARGSEIVLEAQGLADSSPAVANCIVEANALKPPKPAHGRVSKTGSGGVELTWVRRSRVDTGWLDAVDIPQIEGALLFDVSLIENGNTQAVWQVAEQQLVLTETQLAGLTMADPANLTFEVRQVGQFDRSDPLVVPMSN